MASENSLLERIRVNPEIFAGKPTVRGMRISVEVILSLFAQGETVEAILATLISRPTTSGPVSPTPTR